MNWVLTETLKLPQRSYFYCVMLMVVAIRWQYELLVFKYKSKLQFSAVEAD